MTNPIIKCFPSTRSVEIEQRLDIQRTVKLVRKDLKAHYQGVKFSVRSSPHVWAPSIHIEWYGGPTETEVRTIMDHYIRYKFDSNVDGYNYGGPDRVQLPSGHTLCITDYGVNFIHVRQKP